MNIRSGLPSRRLTLAFLAVTALLACTYAASHADTKKSQMLPVSMSGVQHLGSKNSISEFYVNGYYGSNVGREGGGGDILCCVEIPREWREGLNAEVRWETVRWLNSDHPGEESVERVGIYHAIVPVERYEKPGRFWVHFFDGGRVRIVVHNDGPGAPDYPIKRDSSLALTGATIGTPVNAIFSEAELAEITRRRNDERKTGRE